MIAAPLPPTSESRSSRWRWAFLIIPGIAFRILFIALRSHSQGTAASYSTPATYFAPTLGALRDEKFETYVHLRDKYMGASDLDATAKAYVHDLQVAIQHDHDHPVNPLMDEGVFMIGGRNVPGARLYTIDPVTDPWQPIPDGESQWSTLDQTGPLTVHQVNKSYFLVLYTVLPLPHVLEAHHYQAGFFVYKRIPRSEAIAIVAPVPTATVPSGTI